MRIQDAEDALNVPGPGHVLVKPEFDERPVIGAYDHEHVEEGFVPGPGYVFVPVNSDDVERELAPVSRIMVCSECDMLGHKVSIEKHIAYAHGGHGSAKTTEEVTKKNYAVAKNIAQKRGPGRPKGT